MDETDRAQSPVELLIILAAIADEGIPVQTIAPKFSGRFNKGVDYVGDVAQFEREMALDVAAIAYAVKQYGLPDNLKLSVHSGSDKFSIYPGDSRDHEALQRGRAPEDRGNHVAGRADRAGRSRRRRDWRWPRKFMPRRWRIAKSSARPMPRSSTSIRPNCLRPMKCAAGRRSSTLRRCGMWKRDPAYNPSVRQLLHVGFKIAAKMGPRYLDLLEANEAVIAKNVTENLYDRHIAPVFLGCAAADWRRAFGLRTLLIHLASYGDRMKARTVQP